MGWAIKPGVGQREKVISNFFSYHYVTLSSIATYSLHFTLYFIRWTNGCFVNYYTFNR